MTTNKTYYNERAYVILAQRDDGTYIGDNYFKDELNRVYVYVYKGTIIKEQERTPLW